MRNINKLNKLVTYKAQYTIGWSSDRSRVWSGSWVWVSPPSRPSVCRLVPPGLSHTSTRTRTSSLTPPTLRWRCRPRPPQTSSATWRHPPMSPVRRRPTTGRPAQATLTWRGDRPAGEEILGPGRMGLMTEPEPTDQCGTWNLRTETVLHLKYREN